MAAESNLAAQDFWINTEGWQHSQLRLHSHSEESKERESLSLSG